MSIIGSMIQHYPYALEIKDFPNYYATCDGKIYSTKSNKYLAQQLSRDDYLQVNLSKNSKLYCFFVHNLILTTFIGQCPKDMEGCHSNGNKRNNSIYNLRWDTHSNNCKDRLFVGEKNPNAKLTWVQVRSIRQLYNTMNIPMKKLANQFGVSETTISLIINNKTWRIN